MVMPKSMEQVTRRTCAVAARRRRRRRTRARGDVVERARAPRRPTGSRTSIRCSAPIRRRSRCRSGARPRSRSRSTRWCSTPAPARASTACGSGRCAGGGRRPHALLEPWAGAVVNSVETVPRVPGRGAGRAAARRHRARRRLGRRSVRAARARRSRAAPPGQARRTRSCTSTTRRGVVDFAAVLRAPRRARLPRQAQRRVLRPARERLAAWTTPSTGPATSPRTCARSPDPAGWIDAHRARSPTSTATGSPSMPSRPTPTRTTSTSGGCSVTWSPSDRIPSPRSSA